MIVENLEKQFFELKGKLDLGVLTAEQFKAQVDKLRFQDTLNRWWMIGAQSGRWYMYDGVRWVPSQPPRDATSSSHGPIETKPLPVAPRKYTPQQPVHDEPIYEAPARKPSPALPISGPVLIIGGVLIALLFVIGFLFLFDNFTGQSISRAITGGGRPSATATPATFQPATSNQMAVIVATADQLVLQSQIDSAIAQYQNAARVAPTSATPIARWSRALAFKGQTQDAVTKAQQAVQLGPSDADAHAQFCRALLWNGQGNDAIATCEKAVQLDGRNANAHAFLAEAYLLARRVTDAEPQAQTALQLAPQSAEAHRAMAWVLTIQGQKDNALTEWQQTAALEPQLFFRHFELAEVLRIYFNNPLNAIPEYQKAGELYGGYTPAISRLGLAFLAANRPADAVTSLRRAITLNPNNAEDLAYLGIAYGQTNQCNQALPYFDLALKLDANNTVAQRGVNDCKSGKAPTLPPNTPPTVPLAPATVTPK